MPQLKLNLGNVTHTLEEGDLSAQARFSRGTFSVLSDLLGFVQNKPINSLGNETVEMRVGVAEALEWEVPFGSGGLIGISFTPDVRGGIVVRRAGELFRFTSGDDERAIVVRVPAGKAYVSVTLNVGYEANISGEFTHGAFGAGATVDKEQRFRIASHCCVDDTMQVGAAMVEAFRRFRLPFQPGKLPENPQDFVEYEFYGRLALGLSASAGFRGFFFGGRTRAELEKTFRSDTGGAVLRVKPGIGAGVGVDVNWDHVGAFRIVLGSTSPEKLGLYLFKKEESTVSATLSATARVFLVTPFDLQKKVDALLEMAANRAFSGLPEGAKRNALVKALVERMKSSPEVLKNYIEDIKSETNGFLTRLGGVQAAGAQASIEKITANTALFHYEFDLPLAGKGFELALAGNFREAVKQPGVSLGIGSYVEESLVKRSSLSFQVFDAFRAKSVEEFFKKSTIEYLGRGVFQLRFVSGKRAAKEVFGRERAVEMYFVASAESAEGGAIRGQDVSLYFMLSEANDPRAARQIAGVAGSIAPQSGAADALRKAIKKNPKMAARVTCKVAASAYGRLSFTAFRAPNKPHPLPHTEDALNYAAFVTAVDSLFDQGGFLAQGFPNAVDRFGDWAYYNVTVNDKEGSTAPPNRRLRGTPQAWPAAASVRASWIDKGTRPMVRTYLLAAQAFLNLCEDLVILSTRIDDADTEQELKDLSKWIDDLIQKDSSGFPLHFTNPTLVALAARMNAQVASVDTRIEKGAIEIQIELV